MKISCQACEAKYTIADEKVRGKVVKIRCKKCGTAIVVKGTELASPPADYDDAPTRVLDRDELTSQASAGAWTLNVSEGDQRVATTAELIELYRSGTIDDDTFAWRDGMDEWLPIGQLQELKGLLPRVSRPAAPPSIPSQPRAAVREGRASSTDIFGASALAGRDASIDQGSFGDAPQMTGARNESSVLFSLSALTAGGTSPRSTPTEEESSSIVDLKTLMSPSDSAPKPPAKSKVEDIMNIGSGGGIFAPTLAAPDFSSIPPAPEATNAGASAAPAGKSNKGIVFAAIGLAVVLLGGGAAALLMGNEEKAAPVADATASVASAETATEDAPTAVAAAAEEAPSTGEKKADSEQGEATEKAKAAESAEPQAAEPEKAQPAVAPAVARASDKATNTAASPAKATTKTATKSNPPSRPAPAPKATATAQAPARGGEAPPFDRAAALSSLNSASDAARACKRPDGPTGSGRIAVTFAPSGVVTAANVEGPPFAGTSVGSCVAARFRNARVPAFSGGIVTVRKSFTIN